MNMGLQQIAKMIFLLPFGSFFKVAERSGVYLNFMHIFLLPFGSFNFYALPQELLKAAFLLPFGSFPGSTVQSRGYGIVVTPYFLLPFGSFIRLAPLVLLAAQTTTTFLLPFGSFKNNM